MSAFEVSSAVVYAPTAKNATKPRSSSPGEPELQIEAHAHEHVQPDHHQDLPMKFPANAGNPMMRTRPMRILNPSSIRACPGVAFSLNAS